MTTTGRAAVPWATVAIAVLVLIAAGTAIFVIARRRRIDDYDRQLDVVVAEVAWLDRTLVDPICDARLPAAERRSRWLTTRERFADVERDLVRLVPLAPTEGRGEVTGKTLAAVSALRKALDDQVNVSTTPGAPVALPSGSLEVVAQRRAQLGDAVRAWQIHRDAPASAPAAGSGGSSP